jgi:hypothetical protein
MAVWRFETNAMVEASTSNLQPDPSFISFQRISIFVHSAQFRSRNSIQKDWKFDDPHMIAIVSVPTTITRPYLALTHQHETTLSRSQSRLTCNDTTFFGSFVE